MWVLKPTPLITGCRRGEPKMEAEPDFGEQEVLRGRQLGDLLPGGPGDGHWARPLRSLDLMAPSASQT